MVESVFLMLTITVSTMPEPIEFGIKQQDMVSCVAELDNFDGAPFSLFFMGQSIDIKTQCIARPISNQVINNGKPINVLVKADCETS